MKPKEQADESRVKGCQLSCQHGLNLLPGHLGRLKLGLDQVVELLE